MEYLSKFIPDSKYVNIKKSLIIFHIVHLFTQLLVWQVAVV